MTCRLCHHDAGNIRREAEEADWAPSADAQVLAEVMLLKRP